MDLGITGKRALVLASSRGLGLGIATALAREGAHVLLCGRNGERLAENCKAINAEGRGKADWVWADLSDDDFIENITKAVREKLGGLDILVNNTGGPTPGTSEDMSVDKLETFFQTMVLRVITLTNTFLPNSRRKAGPHPYRGFFRRHRTHCQSCPFQHAARRARRLEQDTRNRSCRPWHYSQPHSAGAHPHGSD